MHPFWRVSVGIASRDLACDVLVTGDAYFPVDDFM